MSLEQIIGTVVSFVVTMVPAVMIILKKVGNITKETGELFTAVSKALEDGKVSGDEVRNIIKEAKDVGAAVMTLRDKSL